MSESPNTVHGRLLEAVHIAGYTFERACGELEYLLDEDRWRFVGDGFEDINAFLATLDFSDFKLAVEQRKNSRSGWLRFKRASARRGGCSASTRKPSATISACDPLETAAEIRHTSMNYQRQVTKSQTSAAEIRQRGFSRTRTRRGKPSGPRATSPVRPTERSCGANGSQRRRPLDSIG